MKWHRNKGVFVHSFVFSTTFKLNFVCATWQRVAPPNSRWRLCAFALSLSLSVARAHARVQTPDPVSVCVCLSHQRWRTRWTCPSRCTGTAGTPRCRTGPSRMCWPLLIRSSNRRRRAPGGSWPKRRRLPVGPSLRTTATHCHKLGFTQRMKVTGSHRDPWLEPENND